MFLLLLQVALLLVVARVGAELAKRFGFPAVIGELAAGITLGPSLFGHYGVNSTCNLRCSYCYVHEPET